MDAYAMDLGSYGRDNTIAVMFIIGHSPGSKVAKERSSSSSNAEC